MAAGLYQCIIPLMSKLTHLDEHGRAKMVDVGHKPETERIAIARGEVQMKRDTLELIRAGQIEKGDVLTIAQIAGITASKRTSDLIPLSHPLSLSKVDVDIALNDVMPGVIVTATVSPISTSTLESESG